MKLKKSKFGEFVPVKKNGKIFYGGYQNMLKDRGVSKFHCDRSCVVTAFTNTYLYMFRNDEVFTYKEYNDYHFWIYKILRPKVYGIPTARVLDFKLNRIRRAYHLSLKSHILEFSLVNRRSYKKIVKFLQTALGHDLPVIFFNWLSLEYGFMSHHGVVITEMIEKDDDYILTISSWGRVYKLSLKKFLQRPRTYTGFIYFEREDFI